MLHNHKQIRMYDVQMCDSWARSACAFIGNLSQKVDFPSLRGCIFKNKQKEMAKSKYLFFSRLQSFVIANCEERSRKQSIKRTMDCFRLRLRNDDFATFETPPNVIRDKF
jgi:hypothetical protein